MKNRSFVMKEKVFQFIKDFIEKRGYSPTIKEIANNFNWKAHSSAYSYLIQLAIDSKIDWGKHKTRSISTIKR